MHMVGAIRKGATLRMKGAQIGPIHTGAVQAQGSSKQEMRPAQTSPGLAETGAGW